MKKIGFIDYFLSEWHANNYPAWIKEVNEKSGEDFFVAYGWAELDISPYDGKTTKQWCDEFGVEKCDTIEEVCEKSDYLIILSPDNSEKHLSYAKRALVFGKPTYIDKTFAPSLDEAKKIFELSEKYNAPIFSTSALRFAAELRDIPKAMSIIITGGGSEFERYMVHQLEMAEKVMGTGAKRVMSVMTGNNKQAVVDYGDGRKASINFAQGLPFSVSVDYNAEKNAYYAAINSNFFITLIEEIMKFFISGKPYVKKRQTLEIMALYDAIAVSQKTPYEWVAVKE